MNAIRIIEPYRFSGTWVFDDPGVGLRREPFVAGMPAILSLMLGETPKPQAPRFRCLFSDQPFPGVMRRLTRQRPDSGGTWYLSVEDHMEGWLCPALFKYFPQAPAIIYLRAEV